jgi:hypothetical protein
LFTDPSPDKTTEKARAVKNDENPVIADVLINKSSAVSIRKGITSSGLRYFTLPGYEEITAEYTALAEDSPALKSLRAIRERISLAKLAGFGNTLKSKKLTAFMIMLSVYSYVLLTALVQFSLIMKPGGKNIIPLPPLHYSVLIGSIAVFIISILLRLIAAERDPGFGQGPVESATCVLCFLAAISSLFTLLSFFSPDIHGSIVLYKITEFLRARNILLSALAINASAVIFSPSFPVFACTILVIKIFYDHFYAHYE